MPSDSDAIRRWLRDIQHHLVLAQTFAAGMSYETFRDDLRTTYAVTRCLEIISEASRRLPDELKARHPSIAWKHGWRGRVMIRMSTATAVSLAAVLTMTHTAHADKSASCGTARPATWQVPAIDPVKDITRLIEKGGTTIGGDHVTPHVLAIKDIRRSPFADEQGTGNKSGRTFCYAIVETDHGNFIFKFWYEDTLAGSFINGIRYRYLAAILPDDITIDGDGPYLETAEAVVSQYAMAVKWVPFCEGRSNAWADLLRQRLLAAIPADRPELRARAENIISQPLFLASPKTKKDCLPELNKEDARDGDEVIAGTRSIWGDPFDRR